MAATVALTVPTTTTIYEAGESTPLLQLPSSKEAVAGAVDEPPPLQDFKAESFKEKAVTAVAGVNFVLAVLTLVFQASLHPVVWVSSILGLLVSPLATLQQRKLTEVEALAQTNRRLEGEVDQLTASNNRLVYALQQTEESVYNLQAMQQTLSTLQAVQGQSINDLENQLQESREILASMHTNYKGQLLQNLISVVLAADQDGNMILSDSDIEELIRRLEGINGININDAALRKKIIEHGRCLEAIMDVAKQALLADEGHSTDSSEKKDAHEVLFTFIKKDEEDL